MSAHYAMCKYDDDTGTYVPLEVRPITDELIQDDPLYKLRASSRDAEIAELVGVLGDVTAHLVAAHSLLSRGGKKAAASDTIFKIMLQDYEKSFEAGRKWLRQRLEE